LGAIKKIFEGAVIKAALPGAENPGSNEYKNEKYLS